MSSTYRQRRRDARGDSGLALRTKGGSRFRECAVRKVQKTDGRRKCGPSGVGFTRGAAFANRIAMEVIVHHGRCDHCDSCKLERIAETIDLMNQCMSDVNKRLYRMEFAMAKQSDAIGALSVKWDSVVADIRALLVTIGEEVSPAGQAALDDINTKLDAFHTEIGDADGSDTPPVDPDA